MYVVMNTSDSLALRRAFIPRMISEFAEDEAYIKRRIRRRRSFKGEATPYVIETEKIEGAIETQEIEDAVVVTKAEKTE